MPKTYDPIKIIKNDHATVEKLFKEYESLSDGSVATKRKIADQIIDELTVHAEMEEAICYPRFKEIFNKEDDKLIEEAYVEHEGAKNLLTDLKGLDPEEAEFNARMKVLMEQVRHHVKEEEEEMLPRAKKEVPEVELEAMGDEMVVFKEARTVNT